MTDSDMPSRQNCAAREERGSRRNLVAPACARERGGHRCGSGSGRVGGRERGRGRGSGREGGAAMCAAARSAARASNARLAARCTWGMQARCPTTRITRTRVRTGDGGWCGGGYLVPCPLAGSRLAGRCLAAGEGGGGANPFRRFEASLRKRLPGHGQGCRTTALPERLSLRQRRPPPDPTVPIDLSPGRLVGPDSAQPGAVGACAPGLAGLSGHCRPAGARQLVTEAVTRLGANSRASS